jgi:hypothetical protein
VDDLEKEEYKYGTEGGRGGGNEIRKEERE